jgi:hypothetical protein
MDDFRHARNLPTDRIPLRMNTPRIILGSVLNAAQCHWRQVYAERAEGLNRRRAPRQC